MYRLVRLTDDGALYITGTVRSIPLDNGWDYECETTANEKCAAAFPSWSDARGFQLRLALEGFKIEMQET